MSVHKRLKYELQQLTYGLKNGTIYDVIMLENAAEFQVRAYDPIRNTLCRIAFSYYEASYNPNLGYALDG